MARKKTERFEAKLTADDEKKLNYLVKVARTDKSKVVRGLIDNAYKFVKSVSDGKG